MLSTPDFPIPDGTGYNSFGPAASLTVRCPPSAAHGQNAGLAQLVVHLICNQGVGGSSPSAGTIFKNFEASFLDLYY